VLAYRRLSSFHLSLFAAALLGLSGFQPSLARAGCPGEDGGSSLVTEIRGGDTLVLEDGRAVRPSSILLPRRGTEGGMERQMREQAERALADLVQGQVVYLHLDAGMRDRYGRLLAQIFVISAGERVWVQEQLLTAGYVRAISSRENRDCIAELLAAERKARESKTGNWRSGFFSVKPAHSEELLAGLSQSFEIVEGQVQSVAEVKGRTFLNFGANWRRDFTIIIPADVTKQFPPDTLPLARLKGRSMQVRGWIESFNGPSISITHPEQIELLSSDTASSP